jgi:hypothetical protein
MNSIISNILLGGLLMACAPFAAAQQPAQITQQQSAQTTQTTDKQAAQQDRRDRKEAERKRQAEEEAAYRQRGVRCARLKGKGKQ